SGFVEAAQRCAAGALLRRRLGRPIADEVRGKAVDRRLDARPPVAAAGDLGLEVAGGESGAVADHHGLEVLFEEPARIARRPGCGGGGGWAAVVVGPGAGGVGAAGELGTALAE